MSSISLIVDDRLWFHSVIQTSDLLSFLQILLIPMSSLLARKIRVRLLFMYFFYSILKSVLLGRFSLGDRQLYLLHAFTPISGSGLKTTTLSEYHGSCLSSSKTKLFISNKCIICATRRCAGAFNAH